MALSTEYVVSSLSNLYGETVTTGDVRAWCAMNNTTYQTVSKKLESYKAGRGKWNLTQKEQLEKTFTSPAAMPAVKENLIPEKDDTFVSLVTSLILRKLLSPVYSTQRSLRVFLVMVKRSVLNKFVRRWVVS